MGERSDAGRRADVSCRADYAPRSSKAFVTNKRGKYQAKIKIGGKQRQIGQYRTALAAAEAVDDYLLAYGIAAEELNFPERARQKMLTTVAAPC